MTLTAEDFVMALAGEAERLAGCVIEAKKERGSYGDWELTDGEATVRVWPEWRRRRWHGDPTGVWWVKVGWKCCVRGRKELGLAVRQAAAAVLASLRKEREKAARVAAEKAAEGRLKELRGRVTPGASLDIKRIGTGMPYVFEFLEAKVPEAADAGALAELADVIRTAREGMKAWESKYNPGAEDDADGD